MNKMTIKQTIVLITGIIVKQTNKKFAQMKDEWDDNQTNRCLEYRYNFQTNKQKVCSDEE